MPGSRACPPQIDEPWCGTRQPTTPNTHPLTAPAHDNNERATSTNPLTRPHSFRNADLSQGTLPNTGVGRRGVAAPERQDRDRTRGYRAVPFRNWKVDDAETIAIVRFGPFREPVSFDHYAIFEGDEPTIVVPEESTVSIPRG
jgi:hypothetical protein